MVLWNYLDIKKKDRYPCNAGKQSFSYYNINIIIPFYLSGIHEYVHH